MTSRSPSGAEAALAQWLSFGGISRRVGAYLVTEIARTSDDVAAEIGTLTRIFRELAGRAAAQSARVAQLAASARIVEFEGATITLDELAGVFRDVLDDIVSKILHLSQHAMSTVYALDEVGRSMHEVGRCIAAVDQFNRETQMLAINARIEASRAGEAGRTFSVIADEVRGLSNGMNELAASVRVHVGAVLAGLHESHEALRAVATLDLSENIMAKDRLDRLVGTLVERSAGLADVARDAAEDAAEIARQVGLAITSLQFQDRVAQRLTQVADVLSILTATCGELDADTRADIHVDTGGEAALQERWIGRLGASFKLHEMRAAFLAELHGANGADVHDTEPAASAGSIELF